MTRRSEARVGASALLALLVSACFDAVGVADAYEAEQDLCAQENAADYAARVASCRQRWLERREACGGVLSFTGKLQGVDVVVDSEIEATHVENLFVGDAGAIEREGLSLSGRSPYFLFRLTAGLLGGEVDLGPTPRTLAVGPGVGAGSTWYDDGRADLELELTAGAIKEIQLVRGELELELQTPDEHIGRFAGTSSDGRTSVRGCFHVFTTATRVDSGEP